MTKHSQFTITVPADHPCLPGHFPGRPVVPGAVILAEVVLAATRTLGGGARIAGFPSVKFTQPMLPEQPCQLTFADDGAETVSFELTHDARRLASGSLRYRRFAAEP